MLKAYRANLKMKKITRMEKRMTTKNSKMWSLLPKIYIKGLQVKTVSLENKRKNWRRKIDQVQTLQESCFNTITFSIVKA